MKGFFRFICGLVAVGAVVFGFLYRPQTEIDTRQDTTWLLSLLVAGIALLGVMWVGRGPFTSKRGLDPEDRLRHYVQRVSSVLIVGFILISLQLLRQQVVIANEIEKPFDTINPQGNEIVVQDPRLINETLSNQRGRIFDAAGNEIAGIATSKYKLVKRTYADSPIKQLLGYFSPLQFGNSGLEAEYDDYLSGEHGSNPFANLQRSLLNEPTQGNNLYLTVDPQLQQLSQDTLGNTPGSIVLLDGKTGAVLSMVGYPRFDPAELVFDPTVDDSLWNDQIQTIQQRWKTLNDDPSQPLYMRPTQGLYVPGSIFKTVTLSGMLDTGKAKPDTQWTDNGSYVIDAYKINDPNRPNTSVTTWTSQQGYMFSLNAVFAQMGVQLGADSIRDYSNKFGFGQEVPFDLKTSASQVESTKNYLSSRVAQAETGFGQGQLQLTPLHAALIAAAMGRGDGVMPKPYLVQSIKTPGGQLIKETEPSNWLQTVRPETAKTVHDIMVASATDGWVGQNGGSLKSTGAVVGGKTGTAELGNNLNNAWYIAWASKGDRLFAIAVVIDHRASGEGLSDALPRANKILTAALAGVK